MEQTKKRFGKLWWATFIVAVLMAVIFAFETPLCAYADSVSKGKYVKDTVMITATSLANAKAKVQQLCKDENKTYYLYETPYYDLGGVQTYIAYTTTDIPQNAAKSIKTMNMKGEWSYSEYNAYLDKRRTEVSALAEELYNAILEYVDNLNKKTERALYVKEVLDYFCVDGYEDGTEKNLSDFFVEMASKKDFQTVKEEMITFTMEANSNILYTIQSALLFACADSYEGQRKNDKNFFTGLQSESYMEGLTGFVNNTEYSYLDKYVDEIRLTLPYVQDDIRFYMTSGHMLSDAAEAMMSEQQEDVFSEVDTDDKDAYEQYMEAQEEAISPDGYEGEEKKTAEEVAAYKSYYDGLSFENQTKFNNGKMFYKALKECKYEGYYKRNGDREYECLFDLFMLYEGDDISKYSNDDFYPFLHLLTKGQLGLLKVGLAQLFSSVLMPVKVMDNMLDGMIETVNSTAETEEEKIKKGQVVSVYYKVDRSIFKKDNGVALTSESINAAHSQPLKHIVTSVDKADNICNILAIATGVTATVTMMTAAGLALYVNNLLYNTINGLTFGVPQTLPLLGSQVTLKATKLVTRQLVTVVNNQVTITTANGWQIAATAVNLQPYFGYSQCLSLVLRVGFGIVLKWVSIASIGVMLLVLLTKLLYPIIAPEGDEPYIDIPRVMCAYENVYDQTAAKDGEPIKDYIYYYGVKNPLLTFEDNERAAAVRDKKNNITTNILKNKIGDIANWSLSGLSRQWVAMYVTTDTLAGKPILADSFTVVNKTSAFNDDKDLIPVKMFNSKTPYNFHEQYEVTKDSNETDSFLGYKCDKTAGTQSASVFSDITLWGGTVAGIILGGGIGTLVTYGIIRKRKKQTV